MSSSPSLQFCGEGPQPDADDESEVFIGAVSERECRKASKYSRRTVAFHPDFRRDRDLMRYTMDQLQIMSLAVESDGTTQGKLGSEGTDSFESESPFGSSGSDSRDQSPLAVDSGTDSPPVFSREQLTAWVRRSGIHEIIEKLSDNRASSPSEVVHSPCSPYSDSPRSQVFQDSAVCSPDVLEDFQCNGLSQNGVKGSSMSMKVSEVSPNARLASDDLFSSSDEKDIKNEQGQCEKFVPNPPQKFPKQSTAVNSPLVNTASCGDSTASPPTIIGDINSVCDGGVQYNDVFARNANKSTGSPQSTSLYPGGTSVDLVGNQEVPESLPDTEPSDVPSDLCESNDCSAPLPCILSSRISTISDKSLIFDPDDDEDEDMSILTMGSIMEESIMDCSRRTFRFSDSGDTSMTASHVVPEAESDRPVTFIRNRPGVVFTEKQFSPTLKVRTSPPREHGHEQRYPGGSESPRKLNVKNLLLDLKDYDEDFAASSVPEMLAPESPECLSEVMFGVNIGTPPPMNPKKPKVKRLTPVKSPKANHEDTKTSGSVYKRLYGVKQTPEDSNRPSARPSSAKSAPATNKAESLRRAHSASKLATANKTHTPFHTLGSARRGLTFHGQKGPNSTEKKARADHKHTPCGIKTTGCVDRQALCQATKVSSASKKDPIPQKKRPNSTEKKARADHKHTLCGIKTTGCVDRQALCQATKVSSASKPKPHRTTPKSASKVTIPSKVTPGKNTPGKQPAKVTPAKTSQAKVTPAKVTPAKVSTTPSGAQSATRTVSGRKLQTPSLMVYKKGTPRFPKDASSSSRPQVSPDRIPSLDFSDSVNECDLSVLDDSILLQEKKVELERLHLEKIRLQKQKNKQKPESRTPLIPTTADNLPKVRFTDKRALSLSEPELDAITLVHTLCNSQQSVKLVTKPRASHVVRHSNTPAKSASKLQWNETLTTEINDTDDFPQESGEEESQPRRRSILTIRTPGHNFPYYDQPQSPIVVTKGNRKFTGFSKDPSNLI